MSKIINVNMGEIAVGKEDIKIRTGGIGSCIVIVLYDPDKKVGGMAHAVLPSRRDRDKVVFFRSIEDLKEPKTAAKYADESIDYLLKEIHKLGGKKENLIAKLVGGAMTFKILGDNKNSIGHQNIDSARQKLSNLGIPVESEDTGGTIGRIAEFNVGNGLLEVTTRM